jgi:hypothetical protein
MQRIHQKKALAKDVSQNGPVSQKATRAKRRAKIHDLQDENPDYSLDEIHLMNTLILLLTAFCKETRQGRGAGR